MKNQILLKVVGLYLAAAAIELLMSKDGQRHEGFTLVPDFVWKWYRETFHPTASNPIPVSTAPAAGTGATGNNPIIGGTPPAGSVGPNP